MENLVLYFTTHTIKLWKILKNDTKRKRERLPQERECDDDDNQNDGGMVLERGEKICERGENKRGERERQRETKWERRREL